MSAKITKIELTASNNFIYRDTDDNIQFISGASVSIKPISSDKAELRDVSGNTVSVSYAGFEGVIIGGVLQPFVGDFQDFLATIESIAKPIGGGSGQPGELVAYGFDNTDISTTESTFQDALPPLTQDFEAGNYLVLFSSEIDTSANMDVNRQVSLDASPLFTTNNFNAASRIIIKEEGQIVTLTAGSHTFEFQFRSTGPASTVTLSKRYYLIYKIA